MFQFGIHWKITSIYVDKHALNSWYTLHKFVAKDISWKKSFWNEDEREAESVWKTSRVSENVRSVSQANEWTNLYEWTRLLATALLFPTVQRCTAKCKDAPLHRAKMHCQVQVQCLVRGGIPACQQTHLPTDWQTAHIPATLIHKICPSFTKSIPHSQKLPLIHKSCLSFTKSVPHSQNLPLIH